jgi:hypothetical protein
MASVVPSVVMALSETTGSSVASAVVPSAGMIRRISVVASALAA